MRLLNFLPSLFLEKKKKNSLFISKYKKHNLLMISKEIMIFPKTFPDRKYFLNVICRFFCFTSFNIYPNTVFPEFLKEILPKKIYITKNGLKFISFSKGSGEKPNWGDFIKIHYVIYLLIDNKIEKIDSTYERGKSFLFRHGNGQLISGIEEAVHNMKQGEKRRLMIPINLGYINTNLGPVPPFSINRAKIFQKNINKNLKNYSQLLIDLELLDIKKNF